VLDKIVPGYYHRLNANGNVQTSTCCQNTATEHDMMRKLMVDSVVTWATAYKVDGFRFDLMGHHMLADMQAVRETPGCLTLRKDGVDGKNIYVYGEGWDFGEVAGNARGVNATQLNIGGTGIGTFNDRLRDAARGGNPFDDPRDRALSPGCSPPPAALRNQTRPATSQLALHLHGLDSPRPGRQPEPSTRSYAPTANRFPATWCCTTARRLPIRKTRRKISSMFPRTTTKRSSTPSRSKPRQTPRWQDRVRMNNLAISLVMFSQGVPFFHAGDDLLRSKSLNPNSYDSGDWFNQLDWTYQSNNWGVGLPPEGSRCSARPGGSARMRSKGEGSRPAAVAEDAWRTSNRSPPSSSNSCAHELGGVDRVASSLRIDR
jgi:pullulanase